MRIWNIALSTLILALGLACWRIGGIANLPATFLVAASILPLNLTKQEIAECLKEYRNRQRRSAGASGDREVSRTGKDYDRLFD